MPPTSRPDSTRSTAPGFRRDRGLSRRYRDNSITLSSGDNYLPSPFFNAGSDPSLKEVLETALEDYYNLAAGTLNITPASARPTSRS